jgi:hypothetical protein
MLEPTEHAPLVTLVTCDGEAGGCDTPFAVEVRLTVQIDYSTCRLALPSTVRPDALTELPTLCDPEPEIPF